MLEIIFVFCVSVVASLLLYFLPDKNDKNSQEIKQVYSRIDEIEEELTDLEREISGFLNKNDASGIISVIQENLNAIKIEKSKLNIASIEVVSLENRLRDFLDIEQELENSALETRDVLKSFQNSWSTIKSNIQMLSEKNSILEESIQVLFSGEEADKVRQLFKSVLNDASLLEPIMDNSLEVIKQLKNRFDALDIEFAELYERFGELEV